MSSLSSLTYIPIPFVFLSSWNRGTKRWCRFVQSWIVLRECRQHCESAKTQYPKTGRICVWARPPSPLSTIIIPPKSQYINPNHGHAFRPPTLYLACCSLNLLYTWLSPQICRNRYTLYKNMLESLDRCRLWRDHRQTICCGFQVGDEGRSKDSLSKHSTSTSDHRCCSGATGSAWVDHGRNVELAETSSLYVISHTYVPVNRIG